MEEETDVGPGQRKRCRRRGGGWQLVREILSGSALEGTLDLSLATLDTRFQPERSRDHGLDPDGREVPNDREVFLET